jgi:hypothetical protein
MKTKRTILIIVAILIATGFSALKAQNWLTAGNPLVGGEVLGSTTAQPLVFITSNTERARILSSGNFGIGTTSPSNALDVEQITCTGLIAQQVDSAATQIGYDFNGIYRPADANHLYALSYTQFVMPLIKAVQELSKTNDSLKSNQKTIDSLLIQQKKKDSILTATVNNLITQVANCCTQGSTQKTLQNNDNEQGDATSIHDIELANNAVLYQNSPNPFGNGTTIKYFIPENAIGQIVFFDEFGNKIKVIQVEDKGMGQLNVSASNLAAGMYSYSLVVNEKIIDTKKMIKQ